MQRTKNHCWYCSSCSVFCTIDYVNMKNEGKIQKIELFDDFRSFKPQNQHSFIFDLVWFGWLWCGLKWRQHHQWSSFSYAYLLKLNICLFGWHYRLFSIFIRLNFVPTSENWFLFDVLATQLCSCCGPHINMVSTNPPFSFPLLLTLRIRTNQTRRELNRRHRVYEENCGLSGEIKLFCSLISYCHFFICLRLWP